MSSITKSIQNEYVLLMENAFSEKYKYAFRNLELKELRRFILKELISSPDLRYRFKEFYNKRGRSSGLRSAVSYSNLTG